MYVDDQGNFKGDALVVYFRAESVKLAVQMLDDTQFRSVALSCSNYHSSRAGGYIMGYRFRRDDVIGADILILRIAG